MNKHYFSVPLRAILPNNADKFYQTPKNGSDCPDDAGCSITMENFLDRFENALTLIRSSLLSGLRSAYTTEIAKESPDIEHADILLTGKKYVNALLNFCGFGDYFFSAGSLLNYLGRSTYDDSICNNLGISASNTKLISWDETTQMVYDAIKAACTRIVYRKVKGATTDERTVVFYNNEHDWGNVVPFRTLLEDLHDNGAILVTGVHFRGFDELDAFSSTDQTDPDLYINYLTNFGPSSSLEDAVLDLRRPLAYQIACAHYYTNDQVDYIYSADLYRQNMEALWLTATGQDHLPYFTYNGVKTFYDVLSGNVIQSIFESWYSQFNALLINYTDTAQVAAYFGFLANIFSFRKSLRFMDYFTGARSNPLAVGDVTVPVSSSKVSVIDITKQIQMQRFLNAVNKTGRKISEYIQGIFGVQPPYDSHDPMFLGATSDIVIGSRTQNTGDAQLTDQMPVTARFQSNSEKYAFEFDCTLPSVILGLTSFEFERFYCKASDPQTFNKNRYDEFNPFLEYVGDQPLRTEVLDCNAPHSFIFGYQSRYMEYKQRFNRAVGGFVQFLPGYGNVCDNALVEGVRRSLGANIDPSFIRAKNSDLDYFYVSLTGDTPANYFHFIVKTENDCVASRPMSYNPQIL